MSTMDPIEEQLFAEIGAATRALAAIVRAHAADSPSDASLAAIHAGVQVGIELGLAVAINDVAEGRRLQTWLDAHVHDPRDHAAWAERDRAVERFSRVLR